MRSAIPLALLMALTACGEAEAPGGLTRDERQQLNDAAAMLDANSVALEDVGNTER